MASNRALTRAARAQQDEFYTTTPDIEYELQYYKEHFRCRKILCNCDDPFESKFFEYFAIRFRLLNLAKLTATCYAGSPIAQRQLSLFEEDKPAQERTPYCATMHELRDYNGDGRTDRHDVIWALQNIPGALRKLEGDGDFRSPECIELLKDADVVVTNPPFSLFREYVALLMKYDKKFVIIANRNAITYKEIFPLFMQNKIWLGYGFVRGNAYFTAPSTDVERFADGVYDPEKQTVKFRNCCWFTNLPIKKRYWPMAIFKHYTPEEYPHYDNYDAIEVSRTDWIPVDYDGVMGVPITFMDKYNPEQFEIIGFRKGDDGRDLRYTKDGREVYPYMRILIRRIMDTNA